MESIIAIENLTFEYLPGQPVLKDVSLSIPKGSYVALLGANGSGKSSLARHLNGILLPRTGRVLVRGMDTRDPAHNLQVKKVVGMVFQHPDNQIVATVVEDDVAFGLENFNVPPKEIEERVTWALQVTGLSSVRRRPPHLLSGGQKQRLAIAGAIAMNQEVLILDEATSMLDTRGRREVLELVRQLHEQGTTVLTVTHRMEEVLEADTVFILNHGQLAMTGPPREIFKHSYRLRQFNLDVPAVSQVAGILHQYIPEIPADAITPEELADALFLTSWPEPFQEGPSPSHAKTQDMKMGDAVIQVKNLGHTYLRGTPLEHTALRNANLDVISGKALAIVGATGSGKSTVMQHLNGIYRPQSGTVVTLGIDLGLPKADMRTVRREVGMLFQNPEDQLFEQLVGDDVAYGPLQARMELKEVRRRVRWALEMVGLDFEEFKDRPIFALSGGEKRRVALAGILSLQPKVLVLDEPTAGLDPRSAHDLINRLAKLKEHDVSIVFVTHHIEEVLNLADDVVIMDGGTTAGHYPITEILRDPAVLTRHGFDMPPVLALQQRLGERGFSLPAGRTPDQLAETILRSMGIVPDLDDTASAEEG